MSWEQGYTVLDKCAWWHSNCLKPGLYCGVQYSSNGDEGVNWQAWKEDYLLPPQDKTGEYLVTVADFVLLYSSSTRKWI